MSAFSNARQESASAVAERPVHLVLLMMLLLVSFNQQSLLSGMYGSMNNSEEIKSTSANYAATVLQDKIRWSLHISKVPTGHKESQNAWLSSLKNLKPN